MDVTVVDSGTGAVLGLSILYWWLLLVLKSIEGPFGVLAPR